MSEFKFYRNLHTGKVDYLPVHVGELFFDTMVEDTDDASCIDCALVPVPFEGEDFDSESESEFEDFDFEDTDPVVNTPDKNKDK